MKKTILFFIFTLPLLMLSCGNDEPTLPDDPNNTPDNVDPTPVPDVPPNVIPDNKDDIYAIGPFSSWKRNNKYKFSGGTEWDEGYREFTVAIELKAGEKLEFLIDTPYGQIGCKEKEESSLLHPKAIFYPDNTEYEAVWCTGENLYPFGCSNWMGGFVNVKLKFNKISKEITVILCTGPNQPNGGHRFILEGEFNDWDKSENLYGLSNIKYQASHLNTNPLQGCYFIPKEKMIFLIRNFNPSDVFTAFYAGGCDETVTVFRDSDKGSDGRIKLKLAYNGSKITNTDWPGGFANFEFYPQFGTLYITPDYDHPIYVCGSFNQFDTNHNSNSNYGTLYKVGYNTGNVYKGEIDVKTNDIELNFYTVPGYDVKVGRIGSMKSKQTKPIDMKMIVYQYESVVLDGQGTWKISNWGEPGKMYIRLDMDKMQVIFSRTPTDY